jgi:hypothetical protein
MEVEEPSARSAAESVHHVWWSTDAPFLREQLFLIVYEDRETALEDVERVRMLSVEVRARSRPRVGKERLRDGELVEACFDHDPTAEERFAFAGSEHDAIHRVRV